MAAYVIYQGEVLDPQRYEEYKVLAGASVQAAGGRFIVRGGEFEILEGDAPPTRTVIIEFPTRAAAVSWYHSDEYLAARQVREGAAIARMFVVEGA